MTTTNTQAPAATEAPIDLIATLDALFSHVTPLPWFRTVGGPEIALDDGRWSGNGGFQNVLNESVKKFGGSAFGNADFMCTLANAWPRIRVALATPAPAVGASDWWRKRADEIELQVALSGSTEAMRCFTDMRTLLQSATAAAPASVQPVQASLSKSIEGTVRFKRGDAADRPACVCCPAGGHIYCRHVEWDDWETNHPEHFGKGPGVLVSMFATDKNENEGKRVRVTVEVLASSTPTKGGAS